MLIKGKLTNSESGGQKGELSWITTGVQIQEELSIIDLNRRVINRKEQSVIGPDRNRCTLYLLQDISKKKKRYQQLGQREAVTTLNLDFSPGSIGSKQVPSASFSSSRKECAPSPLCAVRLCFCRSLLVLLCDPPPFLNQPTLFGRKS